MDILAGMLGYVAGIGALFAGLAISFSVFFSTPHESRQTQAQPQSASAMLVRPSTPNKPAAVEGRATQAQRKASAIPKNMRLRLARRVAHRRRHPPEMSAANMLNPRLKRDGLFRRSAPVAGPASRAQVLRAVFSVTQTDQSRVQLRNLQA
jgi:hypothetical protein